MVQVVHPEEVAAIVLQYLRDERFEATYQAFLRESAQLRRNLDVVHSLLQ